VAQQPSSAQHGFGQGIGQGVSQQSSQQPSSAQHGLGQSVVQGVPEQPDAVCSAPAILAHPSEAAIIGQPAILPSA